MITTSIKITYNLGTPWEGTCVFNMTKGTKSLCLSAAKLFSELYFEKHSVTSIESIELDESLPKINTNRKRGLFIGHMMWGKNNSTTQRVSNVSKY